MSRFILGCLFVFLGQGDTLGAGGTASQNDALSDVALTGNIRIDLFGTAHLSSGPVLEPTADEQGTASWKSPWLAAGLSLVVPGAGEFYAESYWKAAAFFVIDVAAWTFAYTYNQKGNDQTSFFEAFANGHWDVAKYADWTVAHASNINPAVDPTQYQVIDANNNVNWSELNRLERDIGEWYSHTLPVYGEQQYYELIGKYEQFYQGWDDADPTLTDYVPIKNKLDKEGAATHFGYYSIERGKANDFYTTASTAVTVAIVNHVLSAIDAAWSAGSLNSDLKARMGMQSIPRGASYAHVPVLQLSYRF